MEIINNEENKSIDPNNKILFILFVVFAVLYIGLAIGVGLIGIKMAEKMQLVFSIRNALMSFLLFLFGYISATKTKSYGKFIVFAVLMGVIIGGYDFFLTKTLEINDFVILLINLFYMLAGFFIGNERDKDEISRTRNIVFIALLLLLVLIGAIKPGFSQLFIIVDAPILISLIAGLYSLAHGILYSQSVWFIYYTLLLYFILFKRKWFYVVPAVVLHIVLSAILFFT